jgi:O-antigen/teichoic acid export membrane protein
MSKTGQTARGVFWNWIALGFGFAVTFFLSPFIVHRLGVVAYGVWGLVVAMTSYMGLLDLGLRGAVIRFVARSHALGDHAESGRAVSGALWLRQWVSLAAIVFSVVFAFLINRLFAIPLESQAAAKWAIILGGTSVATTLYFGVFGGALSALHRFDLISELSIAQTILRASGVVFVLKNGFGILGLAVWELAVVLVINLVQLWLCFRSYPELRISLKQPEKTIMKAFAGYSIWVFLVHIFGQVIYYTDNLVVGAFVSVAAVTFYSIGGSLIEYLRTVVSSLTSTFMPLASNYEASGKLDMLRLLLKQGTRIAILVALPIQVALFFRGETFIRLWMGEQYGQVSGRVLQILLLSQIFTVANSTSINIVFGLAKHKRFAIMLAGEAVANFTISIILARRIGIYGVAIGTVIPSLFTQVILWPRYISQVVGVPVLKYMLESWVWPALTVIPFGIACFLVERHWPVTRLYSFFLQITAILPLYLLTVVVSFRRDLTEILQGRWKWLPRMSATPKPGGI